METNTLQANMKKRLGYSPILSQKFTSFAGVCDEKEFRNAFKINLGSIVIGMTSLLILFYFFYPHLLCLIYCGLTYGSGLGMLSSFFVFEVFLGVVIVSLLLWEWRNSGFLKVFAKRIHALGGSCTVRIIFPTLCFAVLLWSGRFVPISFYGIFVRAFLDVLMLLYIVYIIVIISKCMQLEKHEVLNYLKRMAKVCLSKSN